MTDHHPTDEPDGTPAHSASLRPPGESTGAAPTGAAAGDDLAGDDPGADDGDAGRAGYDAGAVAGDTDAYRPE
jgi:hypothetical protein